MTKEQVTQHVLDFLRPRYFKQVDTTDEEETHFNFISILTECAEYVLEQYKKEENGNRT